MSKRPREEKDKEEDPSQKSEKSQKTEKKLDQDDNGNRDELSLADAKVTFDESKMVMTCILSRQEKEYVRTFDFNFIQPKTLKEANELFTMKFPLYEQIKTCLQLKFTRHGGNYCETDKEFIMVETLKRPIDKPLLDFIVNCSTVATPLQSKSKKVISKHEQWMLSDSNNLLDWLQFVSGGRNLDEYLNGILGHAWLNNFPNASVSTMTSDEHFSILLSLIYYIMHGESCPIEDDSNRANLVEQLILFVGRWFFNVGTPMSITCPELQIMKVMKSFDETSYSQLKSKFRYFW